LQHRLHHALDRGSCRRIAVFEPHGNHAITGHERKKEIASVVRGNAVIVRFEQSPVNGFTLLHVVSVIV
jgi:hypothetical protein